MQSEVTDDVVEAARVLNMKLHSATELGQRTQWIAEALLAERKAALSAAESVGEIAGQQGRYWMRAEGRWSNWFDITFNTWVPEPGVREVRNTYAAPPAPSVAVKAGPLAHALAAEMERMGLERPNGDILHDALSRVLPALSAQVQDVAGWQDISTLEPKDGMIVMGWGEYRERDGFSPAFMRWYDSVGGWSVSAMPFYPTHWMPLPAAPAKQEGGHD